MGSGDMMVAIAYVVWIVVSVVMIVIGMMRR
jgi:hypothetical protein